MSRWSVKKEMKWFTSLWSMRQKVSTLGLPFESSRSRVHRRWETLSKSILTQSDTHEYSHFEFNLTRFKFWPENAPRRSEWLIKEAKLSRRRCITKIPLPWPDQPASWRSHRWTSPTWKRWCRHTLSRCCRALWRPTEWKAQRGTMRSLR